MDFCQILAEHHNLGDTRLEERVSWAYEIRPGGSVRTSRIAEAAFHRVRAARYALWQVRSEARGVRSRLRSGGAALFQPGQPQRVCPRQHARRAAGAVLDAIAGARRRTGFERFPRLFAGAEQVHASGPHANARDSPPPYARV